jgi:hypothetical protein
MKPGIYVGRVIEAVLACTEKNVEYIGITFEVTGPEFVGSCITAQQWWTEKAKPYTKATLEKLGWQGGVRNVNGAAHLELTSEPVPFAVKEDSYNGKTSLKVDWIVSPPFGVRESDKLTGKAAAAFIADLKGEKKPASNGYAAAGNGRSARQEYGPGADDADFM